MEFLASEHRISTPQSRFRRGLEPPYPKSLDFTGRSPTGSASLWVNSDGSHRAHVAWLRQLHRAEVVHGLIVGERYLPDA